MWVVDTCVVLDVLEHDPSHGLKSARFAANRRGLVTRNPDDFRRWFPKLVIREP